MAVSRKRVREEPQRSKDTGCVDNWEPVQPFPKQKGDVQRANIAGLREMYPGTTWEPSKGSGKNYVNVTAIDIEGIPKQVSYRKALDAGVFHRTNGVIKSEAELRRMANVPGAHIQYSTYSDAIKGISYEIPKSNGKTITSSDIWGILQTLQDLYKEPEKRLGYVSYNVVGQGREVEVKGGQPIGDCEFRTLIAGSALSEASEEDVEDVIDDAGFADTTSNTMYMMYTGIVTITF